MFNNLTRKFFDIQAPEIPSPASLLVKHGSRVDSDSPAPEPITITENKDSQQNSSPTPIPADTANLSTANESAKPETPTAPKDEPKAEPIKNQEAPKQVQWQEVLRQQQPDAIFKELGYDEKMVSFLKDAKSLDPKMTGFLDYWKNNGNVKEYLKALNTDFKAMQPEDVMRHQLQEQNPEMSKQDLDDLYTIKVIERYKLDPNVNSEEEIRRGRIELLHDAKPVRESLMKNQENFFLPQPSAKEPQVDVLAELQRKEAESVEEVNKLLAVDPVFRDVLANKKIKFGEGEDAYTMAIDNPKSTLNVLYEKDAIANSLFDEVDGMVIPNVKKQLFIARALLDFEGLQKDLAKHYKAIGGKSAIEPIENASIPSGQPQSNAPVAYKSGAEALAKGGIRYSGMSDD